VQQSRNGDGLIEVYRGKLRDLKHQLDNEEIDGDQYKLARQELEVALAQELPEKEQSHSDLNIAATPVALIIAFALPMLAITLYLVLGTPQALLSDNRSPGDKQPSVTEMVSSLEQHMQENPDDLRGWLLLGRSYAALNQPDKTRLAFERAIQLAPDNHEVLLDYAESVARLQHEVLTGEPAQLIARALQLDPNSIRGRILQGVVLFQGDKKEQAVAAWRKLIEDQTVPARYHDVLRELITAAGGKTTDIASGPAITVTARLDKTLQTGIHPQDTLFIYARAEHGPPMPVAIEQHTAGELPLTITLDDSDAMLPQMKLSTVGPVVVIARISSSGNATAQSGDLQTMSKPVKASDNPAVNLIINTRIP